MYKKCMYLQLNIKLFEINTRIYLFPVIARLLLFEFSHRFHTVIQNENKLQKKKKEILQNPSHKSVYIIITFFLLYLQVNSHHRKPKQSGPRPEHLIRTITAGLWQLLNGLC